jgi:hypothetical protein
LERITSASHSNWLRQLEPLADFAPSAASAGRSRQPRLPIPPDGNGQNASRLLGVHAASARRRENLRSWRVISLAGRLQAPRINGMLHRVTFASLWDSPRSPGLGRLSPSSDSPWVNGGVLCNGRLEHVPKKLLDFFDHVIPRDREAL